MSIRAWVIVMCLAEPAFAAFERFEHGGRTAAMGGVGVAISGAWSAMGNPAGLLEQGERVVSFSYAPTPFGLDELSRGALSFVQPMPFGTFALSAERYGFALYRETTFGLAFSNQVSRSVGVGLAVNYHSLSITGYGSAGMVGVNAGVLVALSDEIRWGVATTNLNSPAIGAARERLPQTYSTGLSYTPISNVTVAVDVVKDIRYPAMLKFGVEYTILDMVNLRGGTATEPSVMHAGLGVRYSFMSFDYAFVHHGELGTTHLMSVSIVLEEF
jgi:hypothetical protein